MRLEWQNFDDIQTKLLNCTLPHKPKHPNLSILQFIGYLVKTLNALFITVFDNFLMIIEESNQNYDTVWQFLTTVWRVLMNFLKTVCTDSRIYPFVQIFVGMKYPPMQSAYPHIAYIGTAPLLKGRTLLFKICQISRISKESQKSSKNHKNLKNLWKVSIKKKTPKESLNF